MNSAKAFSISQETTMWLSFAVWHRSMACMSSSVLGPTLVPNGKWADCLGGC